MKYNFANRVNKIIDPSVRDTLKLASKPGVISFGGGIPNPKLFPIKQIKKITVKILKEESEEVLQYNQTQGYPKLLNQLSKYYSQKWSLKIKPENILVTTGSQQALDLLAKAFLNKNDLVLVENPTYFVALSAFNAYEIKYKTIKIKADGICLKDLNQNLKNSFKFLYLVPTFQNPSGISLSWAKRKKLAELAKNKNFLIIEDDPYGELYFARQKYPSLYSLNQENVIYSSTFSKTLTPGLRIGYLIANKNLIEKLTLIKQGMDLHTSTLSQAIAAEFLKDQKQYQKHLSKIRSFYQQQKQVMIKALAKYAPKNVTWTNPQGGLFLWLTLPKNKTSQKLYLKAVKNNISFIPGYVFYANKKNHRTLRLSFATVSKKNIQKGIKNLVQLIKQI